MRMGKAGRGCVWLRIWCVTVAYVRYTGKHFKCTECNKRLNSVGGMSIHLFQVHRIEVKQ